MMIRFTRRRRRIAFLSLSAVVVGMAMVLVFGALGNRVLYFYSPSDAKAQGVAVGQTINLGGLVKSGSLEKSSGLQVRFLITDNVGSTAVTYMGSLPDLFREGQGVIATGAFGADGIFVATNVLAKHDETYMPPEVAAALKRQGKWRAGQDTQSDGNLKPN